mmetsp:Transcript_24385/g.44074  ORF Transcript_24385/g.44074 Transcript_24385/m.44074 type:complete len:2490 (-) Transcript_24385:1510-8979(-)
MDTIEPMDLMDPMQAVMNEAQRAEKDRIDLQRRLAMILLNEKLHMAIVHFQAAFRGARTREQLQRNQHPWVSREMLLEARSRAHEALKELRGHGDGQDAVALGREDSMGKTRVMYTILNAVLDAPNDVLAKPVQAPPDDDWCMFVPSVDVWLFQLAMANFISDVIGTEVNASQLRVTDCQQHEMWQTIVAWEFVDISSQIQRSAFEALTTSDTPLDTYFTKWGLCQGGPNPVAVAQQASTSLQARKRSVTAASSTPRSDLLAGAPVVQSKPTEEGQVDVVRNESILATQVNGQAAVIVKLASGPPQPPRQEHASPPQQVKNRSREASGQRNSNRNRSRQSPARTEKELKKRLEQEEAVLKMEFMAQQIAQEESLKRQLQGKINEGNFGAGTRHMIPNRTRSSATPEGSTGLSAIALQTMGQVGLAERVGGTLPLPNDSRDELVSPGSTHEHPPPALLAVHGPQGAAELMRKRREYVERERQHVEDVRKHRRELRERDLLLFQEWKAKAVSEICEEKERIIAEQQRLAEEQAARRKDQQWAVQELERRKSQMEEESRLRKQWMKEDFERRHKLELELRKEDDEMLQKYLLEREAVRVERLQLEELKEELGKKKRDFLEQEVAAKAEDLAVELELKALTERMDATTHEVEAMELELAGAYEQEGQEWLEMQQQMIEKQNEMDALAFEIQMKNVALLTEDEINEERQIFEEFCEWKRSQMCVPTIDNGTTTNSQVDKIVEENQLKAEVESAALKRRLQVLEQAEAYSQAQDMQAREQADPPTEKPNIGVTNYGSHESNHVELDRAQKALSDARQAIIDAQKPVTEEDFADVDENSSLDEDSDDEPPVHASFRVQHYAPSANPLMPHYELGKSDNASLPLAPPVPLTVDPHHATQQVMNAPPAPVRNQHPREPTIPGQPSTHKRHISPVEANRAMSSEADGQAMLLNLLSSNANSDASTGALAVLAAAMGAKPMPGPILRSVSPSALPRVAQYAATAPIRPLSPGVKNWAPAAQAATQTMAVLILKEHFKVFAHLVPMWAKPEAVVIPLGLLVDLKLMFKALAPAGRCEHSEFQNWLNATGQPREMALLALHRVPIDWWTFFAVHLHHYYQLPIHFVLWLQFFHPGTNLPPPPRQPSPSPPQARPVSPPKAVLAPTPDPEPPARVRPLHTPSEVTQAEAAARRSLLTDEAERWELFRESVSAVLRTWHALHRQRDAALQRADLEQTEDRGRHSVQEEESQHREMLAQAELAARRGADISGARETLRQELDEVRRLQSDLADQVSLLRKAPMAAAPGAPQDSAALDAQQQAQERELEQLRQLLQQERDHAAQKVAQMEAQALKQEQWLREQLAADATRVQQAEEARRAEETRRREAEELQRSQLVKELEAQADRLKTQMTGFLEQQLQATTESARALSAESAAANESRWRELENAMQQLTGQLKEEEARRLEAWEAQRAEDSKRHAAYLEELAQLRARAAAAPTAAPTAAAVDNAQLSTIQSQIDAMLKDAQQYRAHNEQLQAELAQSWCERAEGTAKQLQDMAARQQELEGRLAAEQARVQAQEAEAQRSREEADKVRGEAAELKMSLSRSMDRIQLLEAREAEAAQQQQQREQERLAQVKRLEARISHAEQLQGDAALAEEVRRLEYRYDSWQQMAETRLDSMSELKNIEVDRAMLYLETQAQAQAQVQVQAQAVRAQRASPAKQKVTMQLAPSGSMSKLQIVLSKFAAKLPTGLSREEKTRRTQLFRKFDGGNGRISLQEAHSGLLHECQMIQEVKEAKPAIMTAYQAAIQHGGSQGEETITFPKFRMFLQYLQKYFELWLMFMVVDADGDRRLTFEEIDFCMPKLMEWGMQETDPETVFQEMDTSAEGMVSFAEFAAWAMEHNVCMMQWVEEATPEQEDQAATQIQSSFRGHRARQTIEARQKELELRKAKQEAEEKAAKVRAAAEAEATQAQRAAEERLAKARAEIERLNAEAAQAQQEAEARAQAQAAALQAGSSQPHSTDLAPRALEPPREVELAHDAGTQQLLEELAARAARDEAEAVHQRQALAAEEAERLKREQLRLQLEAEIQEADSHIADIEKVAQEAAALEAAQLARLGSRDAAWIAQQDQQEQAQWEEEVRDHEAALAIQTSFRGHRARRAVDDRRQASSVQRRDRPQGSGDIPPAARKEREQLATIKIQAHWRSGLARREVAELRVQQELRQAQGVIRAADEDRRQRLEAQEQELDAHLKAANNRHEERAILLAHRNRLLDEEQELLQQLKVLGGMPIAEEPRRSPLPKHARRVQRPGSTPISPLNKSPARRSPARQATSSLGGQLPAVQRTRGYQRDQKTAPAAASRSHSHSLNRSRMERSASALDRSSPDTWQQYRADLQPYAHLGIALPGDTPLRAPQRRAPTGPRPHKHQSFEAQAPPLVAGSKKFLEPITPPDLSLLHNGPGATNMDGYPTKPRPAFQVDPSLASQSLYDAISGDAARMAIHDIRSRARVTGAK